MLKTINLSGKSCTLDRLDDFLDDFMKTERVDIEIFISVSVAELTIRGRSEGYSYGIRAFMLTDELICGSTEKVGDYIIGLWNAYDRNNKTRTNYDFLKDHMNEDILAALISQEIYINACKFCKTYDYKAPCDHECYLNISDWLNSKVNYDECTKLLNWFKEFNKITKGEEK